MSVQSLKNGSLELRELNVSNAYKSESSGYVPRNNVITTSDNGNLLVNGTPITGSGTGNATLAGTNAFIGTNTFNTSVPTSTITQYYPIIDQPSTPNATKGFATIGYVNSVNPIIPKQAVVTGSNCTLLLGGSLFSSTLGNLVNYSFNAATISAQNTTNMIMTFSPPFSTALGPSTHPITYIAVYNQTTGNQIVPLDSATITQSVITITPTNGFIIGNQYWIQINGFQFTYSP